MNIKVPCRLIRLVLLMVAILVSMPVIAGCKESSISAEAHKYLDRMQVWHEKWDNYEWELFIPFSDSMYDDLLIELMDITPPRERIPRTKEKSDFAIWPPLDHDRYLDAHRIYLSAQRHMDTMQEIEDRRFRERGDDHLPACDIAQHINVSEEYKEACLLKSLALRHLASIRAEWETTFWSYFPERYK